MNKLHIIGTVLLIFFTLSLQPEHAYIITISILHEKFNSTYTKIAQHVQFFTARNVTEVLQVQTPDITQNRDSNIR